jgi:hypothetical protein
LRNLQVIAESTQRLSEKTKIAAPKNVFEECTQTRMESPEAGDVVRGSGSVRKLRWKRKGMGKRGGLRVIYFVRYQPNEFWMLTLYTKASQDNVPAHILKQLKEAFERA